jgi:hypothetical protein
MTRLMRMVAAAIIELYESHRITTVMRKTTEYDRICKNCGGDGGDHDAGDDDDDVCVRNAKIQSHVEIDKQPQSFIR